MKEDYLECPICGKKLKSLYNHLVYSHNYTKEKIKEEFKDKNIPLHLDTRKRGNHKCDVCGKGFSLFNALQAHKRTFHPSEYEKSVVIDKSNDCDKLECSICGKRTVNLFCHVKSAHNVEWDDYIEKYNYKGPKVFFTDKHKESLSKNKKIFYRSDRGMELRDEQSEMYRGDKNPACDLGVRKKISDSAIKRVKKDCDVFSIYS